MSINFNGLGENVATFMTTDKVQVGTPVKMSTNDTVTACSVTEPFCGICISVRDGYASIQLAGYVTMPTKSKIGVGYQKLTASLNNTVAVNSSGRDFLVINSTETKVGFIL